MALHQHAQHPEQCPHLAKDVSSAVAQLKGVRAVRGVGLRRTPGLAALGQLSLPARLFPVLARLQPGPLLRRQEPRAGRARRQRHLHRAPPTRSECSPGALSAQRPCYECPQISLAACLLPILARLQPRPLLRQQKPGAGRAPPAEGTTGRVGICCCCCPELLEALLQILLGSLGSAPAQEAVCSVGCYKLQARAVPAKEPCRI